jgi:cyclophilin family peptidyl-prolyl cis-trans isomerase
MRGKTMLSVIAILALGIFMASLGAASAQDKTEKTKPVVMMKTTLGDIVIELNPEKAPETVKNFLWYVDNKFYDGLIFHRVISNFMIQGGGFTKDMAKKEPKPPIKNEADNGLSNVRGTIAMARTGDPNSASSQFFINVKDNTPLDFKSKTSGQTWGYCVFGKVIDGMDTVDKIRDVPTHSVDVYNDVPVDPVIITKAYRLSDDELKALKAKKK